jgi:Whirly transcription factor
MESSTEKPRSKDRLPEYAIYKPNPRSNGGVVRFELNREKGAVFVDGANQSGEKQFDWEKKITMKWGLSDLGAALAVLERRAPEAKLFHKTEKSNSAFELVTQEAPDRAPYFIRMSHQDVATRQVKKVGIPLTHSEAAVLETLLKTAVVRLMGW